MRKLVMFFIAACCGVFAYTLMQAEEAARESGGSAPAAGPQLCAAKTKSGKPCSREAEPGSGFCWQHGG